MTMDTLNKANTSFALDFFKQQLQEDGDKNILFSPWSISSALATVYLGAKGNTADEMAKVSLGFKSSRLKGLISWSNVLHARNLRC